MFCGLITSKRTATTAQNWIQAVLIRKTPTQVMTSSCKKNYYSNKGESQAKQYKSNMSTQEGGQGTDGWVKFNGELI